MKRLTFALSVVLAMLMVFSACETDDLDNPVITLVGGDMEIVLNDPDGFVEPGWTANDEQDGDLTNNVSVVGTVDVTKIGTYELIYSVSDKAGNKAQEKRIVDVIVNQATFAGIWSVNEEITGTNPDPNWNYTATVSASSSNTMALLISNFGGFSNFVATVIFDKFGNFTINNQSLIGAPVDGTIEGDGTTSLDGKTLFIDYEVDYTAGGTDFSEGVWTKAK